MFENLSSATNEDQKFMCVQLSWKAKLLSGTRKYRHV